MSHGRARASTATPETRRPVARSGGTAVWIRACASDVRPAASREGAGLERTTIRPCSELQPEAELSTARLIGDVRVLARLPVARIDLGQRVTAVVFVIEEIEDLCHGVQGHRPTERHALPQAQVHTVKRASHEIVLRNDGAIRTQAVGGANAAGAVIAKGRAVVRGKPFA